MRRMDLPYSEPVVFLFVIDVPRPPLVCLRAVDPGKTDV